MVSILKILNFICTIVLFNVEALESVDNQLSLDALSSLRMVKKGLNLKALRWGQKIG